MASTTDELRRTSISSDSLDHDQHAAVRDCLRFTSFSGWAVSLGADEHGPIVCHFPLTSQNNVDAGEDGGKLFGWKSSDLFRQYRFIDRNNQ